MSIYGIADNNVHHPLIQAIVTNPLVHNRTMEQMQRAVSRHREEAEAIIKMAKEANRSLSADEKKQYEMHAGESERISGLLEGQKREFQQAAERIANLSPKPTVDIYAEGRHPENHGGHGGMIEQRWGLKAASGFETEKKTPVAVDLNRFNTEITAYMQGQIMAVDSPVYVGTGANVESIGATVPSSVLSALAAYGNVDSFALAGARQVATDDTNPLTLPVISSGAAASVYAEGASATDSQPFDLASFTFGGSKYSRLVKASEEALMNSGIDLASTILDELADGVASTFTAAITTAMVTALTGNANVLVAEGDDFYSTLGSLLHSIPSRFAGTTNKWMLSRATLAAVKDVRATGSGVPLFDPVANQIFGRDVVLNDNLTGGRVVFGDWGNGAFIRKTPFRVQRLVEAFASAGQIGFKATQWLDSKFLASLSGVTNQPLKYATLTLS